MRTSVLVLWVGLCVAGCARRDSNSSGRAPSPPNPAFDQKWSSIAKEDVDVFYIEDDRGEGLMGNVRRARQGKNAPAPQARPAAPSGPPEKPSPEEVQQVIRQNLQGVRACYLRIAREGDQRSGKAIVSFQIGPAGDVQDTKVDAPAFQGTSLPNCVSGTVSRWAFPKSQKGGLAISYPFVFVGG